VRATSPFAYATPRDVTMGYVMQPEPSL